MAELRGQGLEVQFADDLEDCLGTHSCPENARRNVLELPVLRVRQELHWRNLVDTVLLALDARLERLDLLVHLASERIDFGIGNRPDAFLLAVCLGIDPPDLILQLCATQCTRWLGLRIDRVTL